MNNNMVIIKKVPERRLTLRDSTFNIENLYNKLKVRLKDMNYLLTEKEQEFKSTQYGDKIVFKFNVWKEIDTFGKIEIDIDFVFDKIKKTKGMHRGDLVFTIKPKVILDHKHRWGKSVFSKFLMFVYMNTFREEVKKKYFVPVIKESIEIYNYVKELLDEYKH